MRRRILKAAAIWLVLTAAVMLAGCGQHQESETQARVKEEETAADTQNAETVRDTQETQEDAGAGTGESESAGENVGGNAGEDAGENMAQTEIEAPYTVDTPIEDVINDPVFGDYGRGDGFL